MLRDTLRPTRNVNADFGKPPRLACGGRRSYGQSRGIGEQDPHRSSSASLSWSCTLHCWRARYSGKGGCSGEETAIHRRRAVL